MDRKADYFLTLTQTHKFMAENKKSVLLYCDIIHTVDKLTDEEAGRLFKHYLMYINDMNPSADRLTDLLFGPIKENLKRDLKKWEQKSERNKVIATEGWEKRKDANACERIKDDAKNADKDKVTVTDTVNVTDTVKRKIRIGSDFNFDFVSDDFNVCFFRFLDYRKKIHKEFKTQMSLEACYKNLIELSKRDKDTAIAIVEQSIANQWQGLFELKEKNSAKKENNGNTTNRAEEAVNSANDIAQKRGWIAPNNP